MNFDQELIKARETLEQTENMMNESSKEFEQQSTASRNNTPEEEHVNRGRVLEKWLQEHEAYLKRTRFALDISVTPDVTSFDELDYLNAS